LSFELDTLVSVSCN